MVSPPIQVFLTTIASQPALRQRQEYILRVLQAKNITYSSYDLASDEDAKRLWRRKAPPDKQQLPGILIGGTCPGSFSDFEEAVEYGELETFLRLKDTWDETIEETRPTLPAKPIGVPGASSPSQMAKPAHRALFNASPGGGPSSPLRGATLSSSSSSASASASAPPAETKKSLRERREAEFDVSEELTGYGLQGVKVTDDDLLALVEELGLGGEEAGDLVKGLSDPADKADSKVKEDEAAEMREGGGSDGGGGGGGSEQQPESKSEASAEAKPVAREEAEAAAGGDGIEKGAPAAEEVAETDAGTPST